MTVSLPAKGPLSSRNLGVLVVWMKERGRCEKAKRSVDNFPSKEVGQSPGEVQRKEW